jgi:hypothetical protein
MTIFADPTILFFIFGVFAGLIRSNLEIPQQIAKFLSLYLLMALGLKGGFALAASGFTTEIVVVLGLALFLSFLVPTISYLVLRRFLNGYDTAAVAATYGSISAVTFVTATQFLSNQSIEYGGFMAAAMAIMESPAIIMAVALAAGTRAKAGVTTAAVSIKGILHESFTDGAHILLLAAMAIGMITGETGSAAMHPFTGELFKGMLAFFLLDMGLQVAKNVPELRGKSPWLLAYAVTFPVIHAAIALGLCLLLGVTAGNAALMMVLAASASYIAVPAVVKHAIPEANPSVYFGLSLGITFPFNILVGIPLYTMAAQRFIA